MNDVAELNLPPEVFAVSGEHTSTTLAEHVHALAAVGEKAWADHIDPRSATVSVAQVEAALRPVPRHLAQRRLARLLSGSLVSSYDLFGDERARELAGRVVTQLGDSAEWWSNEDPELEGARTRVTRCTVDGVVVARNATHFVVVLQLGED
ncbi:MAG TPA: hypothetical protein VGL47_46965 [Amycolatopsis sp.]|uniref:hypothetical protein n=1 Tax=Amycolatopsis sp. TaxID=37632 RepID=UPI002F3EED26